MQRFFFDFREADDRVPDAEGTELANVDEAYLEAFRAAQEMWSELLTQRRDPHRCRFEVRSADAVVLFVLPFHEILDSCSVHHTAPLARTFEQLAATHSYARRVPSEFALQIQTTHRVLEQSRELLRRVKS